MEEFSETEFEDHDEGTQIAIALDGFGRDWELLSTPIATEAGTPCFQLMVQSDYVQISVVTYFIKYRDVEVVDEDETYTYVSSLADDSLLGGDSLQTISITKTYSSNLKKILYRLEIGGGGLTVDVSAPESICAALLRLLEFHCYSLPSYDR
jgi:hypothetical protein